MGIQGADFVSNERTNIGEAYPNSGRLEMTKDVKIVGHRLTMRLKMLIGDGEEIRATITKPCLLKSSERKNLPLPYDLLVVMGLPLPFLINL